MPCAPYCLIFSSRPACSRILYRMQFDQRSVPQLLLLLPQLCHLTSRHSTVVSCSSSSSSNRRSRRVLLSCLSYISKLCCQRRSISSSTAVTTKWVVYCTASLLRQPRYALPRHAFDTSTHCREGRFSYNVYIIHSSC